MSPDLIMLSGTLLIVLLALAVGFIACFLCFQDRIHPPRLW